MEFSSETKYESSSSASVKRAYLLPYLATQLIGLVLLVLLLVWLTKHLGGLGFSNAGVIFNFHPLLMILGFILLYGNSMLIYRTLRGQAKYGLKVAHASLNGIIIVVVALALWAVIYGKVQSSGNHIYTLHSWLGVLTCALFVSQFLMGLGTYLFPGAPLRIRKLVMPFHRVNGVAIFVVAAAACLTGLNEKAIFSIPDYSSYSSSGLIVNFITLLLVAFVAMTVYLVRKRQFKRKPLPTD